MKALVLLMLLAGGVALAVLTGERDTEPESPGDSDPSNSSTGDKTSSDSGLAPAWTARREGAENRLEQLCKSSIDSNAALAQEQQSNLQAFPDSSDAASFWALNDVGTALWMLAEQAERRGEGDLAKKYYQRLAAEYPFSQCYDPRGWYWRPAKRAELRLEELRFE